MPNKGSLPERNVGLYADIKDNRIVRSGVFAEIRQGATHAHLRAELRIYAVEQIKHHDPYLSYLKHKYSVKTTHRYNYDILGTFFLLFKSLW